MKLLKNLFVLCICIISVMVFSSCGNMKKITIIQYVSAPALDNATEGIINGLKAEGFIDGENVKISVLNPQAKSDTLTQMVEKAVEDSDLIFAIATPVAQSLVAELKKTGSKVPVLFTAVTDPVSSGILEEGENHLSISGTSDINPVADQISLIKEIKPSATKIGFIYTTGETNSLIQLNMAKDAAKDLNISIEAKSCTNQSDLEMVLNDLLQSGIDALYVPTDNEMASQMKTIAQKCNLEKVITICGETGLLVDGGTITCGAVDYLKLGEMTGLMGAKALNGEDVSKMGVGYYSGKDTVANKDIIAQFELEIPTEILNNAKDIK